MTSSIVHVADTFEVLPSLEGGFNMVFLDPPYNLKIPKHSRIDRGDGSKVKGVTEKWDQFDSDEAYEQFVIKTLELVRDVIDEHGNLFVCGTYQSLPFWTYHMRKMGWWVRNQIIWAKSNPMPHLRASRLCASHEVIIWATPTTGSGYTFNYEDLKQFNDGKQLRDVIRIPVCRGHERLKHPVKNHALHPTQKPSKLLEILVKGWTVPEQRILDPFAGVLTTATVGIPLERMVTSIERDNIYVSAAVKERYIKGGIWLPEKDMKHLRYVYTRVHQNLVTFGEKNVNKGETTKHTHRVESSESSLDGLPLR